MSRFIYSAWFLNTDASNGDQDREWVACIGMEAGSDEEALHWGDALALHRAQRYPRDKLVRSYVEQEGDGLGVTDWSSLPRIKAGDAASDDEIGW